jgi:hypothetical protein
MNAYIIIVGHAKDGQFSSTSSSFEKIFLKKGLQIVKHNNKKESRLSACIFSTPKNQDLRH